VKKLDLLENYEEMQVSSLMNFSQNPITSKLLSSVLFKLSRELLVS